MVDWRRRRYASLHRYYWAILQDCTSAASSQHQGGKFFWVNSDVGGQLHQQQNHNILLTWVQHWHIPYTYRNPKGLTTVTYSLLFVYCQLGLYLQPLNRPCLRNGLCGWRKRSDIWEINGGKLQITASTSWEVLGLGLEALGIVCPR